MNFQDNMYPLYLQTLLNDSRLEGTACDVILVVDSKEMKAHRSVLSAVSPYFSTMFHSVGRFKESREEKVTLHDIDSDSVATLLEYIYTSKVKITQDNVFELMDASNLLQIHSLRTWISIFLQSICTTENCLSLYVKASIYNYNDLSKIFLNYIFENFSLVIKEDEFLDLSGSDLMSLLSSKYLNVIDESVLLQSTVRWLNADLENRIKFAVGVFDKIELMNIPIAKLLELRNEPLFQAPTPNEAQTYLNEKIIKWHAYNKGSQPNTGWDNIRYGSQQGVVLAIGGDTGNVISKSVECFTPGFDSWKCVIPQYVHATKGPQNLTALPPMNRSRHHAAVACDASNIYVMGGRGTRAILDDCEAFSINTCTWTTFKSIPRKLEGGSAVMFEGRLYYIGGRDELGPTNEGWEWDRGSQNWKPLAPLKHPRAFHCAVAFEGYIYVLGGFGVDREIAYRSGERYDPSVNQWFEIRGMQKARGKFGCAAVNNAIYVMGGMDRNCGLMSVEKYNVEADEWSYMSPMLVPRHSFSVAVCEKKIFCIGGSDTIHVLHSVDKFNPLTNRWHFLLSMQMCRCGLVAGTLMLPYINCGL